MEKITVNTSARENRVKEMANECLESIKQNALKGNSITELYIEKEIASEVRKEIERRLDESKTSYEFLVVYHDVNQYTGKPQSFTGKTIGNERYYKIKIYPLR